MVPDGLGTGRGREDKMAAMEQVIWESFLMRRARDLERLWRGDLAGDPICRKFFSGLGKWLEKCRAPVGETPLCLTCEQTFCNPAQPPLTFLVTYSEEPRNSRRPLLILTGVCWRCAKKSDAELLKYGSELTAQLLRGRVQGS